ncbi:MAG: glucose-1-phosphate thymidylyltransferase [Chloroflexi bacterium]|nr:glucose-1-phosphate thymidylyltransferase [Chloroflexota bacterium]MBI4506679.1 glucose-1-phosphate thymidylyltransferase [Chloroflexota bacterium]
MKGLILSGGKGTRLRPITYTSAKQLVPVANKPVLFYAIEYLRDAGIHEVGIVVGDTRAEIRAAVGDGARWGVRVAYVEQPEPLGLAHAVKVAEPFLGRDRFVMILGDNVIEGGIAAYVQTFRRASCQALVILTPVADPQNFGVAELADGQIVRLVEKPRDPPSNLALVGIYMFDQHIFEAVNAIRPSARGELEITDAIQHLIDRGYAVEPVVHQGWWFDTGKMEDLLAVNRCLLETLEPRVEGRVDEASQLHGRVAIAPGAVVVHSVLRGPVSIGERTRVVDAYIGPFTSIGHDCVIEDCEIEHSIVMEHCRIVDVHHRLEDCLIGRNVEVSRSPLKPRAYKLMLGDNSKVGII